MFCGINEKLETYFSSLGYYRLNPYKMIMCYFRKKDSTFHYSSIAGLFFRTWAIEACHPRTAFAFPLHLPEVPTVSYRPETETSGRSGKNESPGKVFIVLITVGSTGSDRCFSISWHQRSKQIPGRLPRERVLGFFKSRSRWLCEIACITPNQKNKNPLPRTKWANYG